MNYLVAWGEGGCWSGYPNASVVEADSSNKAEDKLWKKIRADWNKGSLSYDSEEITGEVSDCPLFTRLKPSAIKRLEEWLYEQSNNALTGV